MTDYTASLCSSLDSSEIDSISISSFDGSLDFDDSVELDDDILIDGVVLGYQFEPEFDDVDDFFLAWTEDGKLSVLLLLLLIIIYYSFHEIIN